MQARVVSSGGSGVLRGAITGLGSLTRRGKKGLAVSDWRDTFRNGAARASRDSTEDRGIDSVEKRPADGRGRGMGLAAGGGQDRVLCVCVKRRKG